MDLLNLLEQLTAASGVSGSENSIAAVAQELLTPYCDTVEQRQGNVIGILGERQSGKPHVLLDAHMDQVGFLSLRLQRTVLSVLEMPAGWTVGSCQHSVS